MIGRSPGRDRCGADRTPLAFYDFAGAPLARLVGFFVYASGEDTFGSDLGILATLVGRGKLDPQLGSVRDWAQTTDAVEALRRRSVTGKTVLTVPTSAEQVVNRQKRVVNSTEEGTLS